MRTNVENEELTPEEAKVVFLATIGLVSLFC